MSFTTAALLVAWVAIALLALGFAGLMRQLGELHRSLGPASSRAGATTGTVRGLALPPSGELAQLRPAGGDGGILVFVSPGCSSCEGTLTELAATGPSGSVVVVSSGTCPGDVPAGATCLSDARALMDRLAVPGTPYLVDVDADGVIGETMLPQGPEQVRVFVEHRHTARAGGR